LAGSTGQSSPRCQPKTAHPARRGESSAVIWPPVIVSVGQARAGGRASWTCWLTSRAARAGVAAFAGRREHSPALELGPQNDSRQRYPHARQDDVEAKRGRHLSASRYAADGCGVDRRPWQRPVLPALASRTICSIGYGRPGTYQLREQSGDGDEDPSLV
jgi:hypothetical protein